MIKHKRYGNGHELTPLTEKAARFLNTFVGQTLIVDEKYWQSIQLEMSAAGVWVMGTYA